MRNVGFWMCAVLFALFFLFGAVFAIGKEKAAGLVSGFNTLPRHEQKKYDKARISRDMRNQCLLWAGIMLVGAVLSYWISPYLAIPAGILWLGLLFRDVRLDEKKAFERYLLK